MKKSLQSKDSSNKTSTTNFQNLNVIRVNDGTLNSPFFEEKKIKSEKDKKTRNRINLFILENWLDDIDNELESNVFEDQLTYFEKQNLFFKKNRNVAKKIPYELAFTQEIVEEDGKFWKNSICITETKDYDKIVPKVCKNIELLEKKDKLADLFLIGKKN